MTKLFELLDLAAPIVAVGAFVYGGFLIASGLVEDYRNHRSRKELRESGQLDGHGDQGRSS